MCSWLEHTFWMSLIFRERLTSTCYDFDILAPIQPLTAVGIGGSKRCHYPLGFPSSQSSQARESSEKPLLQTRVVSRRGSKKERRHLAPAEAVEQALDQKSNVLLAACNNTLNNWDPAPDSGPDIYICTKAKRANGSDVWCESCIKYIRRFISEAGHPKPGRGTHIYLMRLSSPSGGPELEDIVSIFCVNADRNYDDPDYGYCRECKAPHHNERDEGGHTDWLSTAP